MCLRVRLGVLYRTHCPQSSVLHSPDLPGAACRVPSFRVRWGHPWGIGPEARVGVVSPVSSDQNKKGAFIANTHPTFTNQNPSDCASLQIFRKIQKGPFPGLICAILDRKKGAL
nr:MAG TPA: hypothetical protein [Caudoviricetes sp.]DAH64499.1 MAG TPA: hypothetical protein [Caudoviricetes sp.]